MKNETDAAASKCWIDGYRVGDAVEVVVHHRSFSQWEAARVVERAAFTIGVRLTSQHFQLVADPFAIRLVPASAASRRG